MSELRATFVGRDRERAALSACAARARSGRPALVLVDGPPGVGKSALVRGALSGFSVLAASGDPLESSFHYGFAQQWLHDEPSGDPVDVGIRLLGVLTSSDEPVALVIDDAQWADLPSLQALAFALRRLHTGKVLVVAVTRDELPDGLRRLFRDASRLSLTGLSVAELGELAAHVCPTPIGAAALARLRAHTGGSPLHAEALLRQAPELLADPLGFLPAPRGYAMDVQDRLSALAGETRALVRAASVLGEECPLWQAERLAGTPDAILLLDEAAAAGLLEHRVGGGDLLVAFPDPLTRAAVYEGLRPFERARWHLDAAGICPDPAARLRHRVSAVSRADDTLAGEVAAFAREQAAAGSWAVAADHFERAARLAVSPRDRGVSQAEAVHALLLAGQTCRAAELAQEPNAHQGARAFAAGIVEEACGDGPRARELLELAWRHRDPSFAGPVATALARLALSNGRLTEGHLWAFRASGAGAGFVQTMAEFAVGRLDKVLDNRLPDPAVASSEELDLLTGRAAVRLWTGDAAGALADLRGVSGEVAEALRCLAEVRAGAWDDALSRPRGTWTAPFTVSAQAMVHAARGDLGVARALLTEWGPVSGLARAFLASAAAFADLVEGKPENLSGIRNPEISLAAGLATCGYAGSIPLGILPISALGAEPGDQDHRRLNPATGADARGKVAAATAPFEKALLTPDPFERARAEFAFGAFLRRSGRRTDAAAHLKAACEGFRALGAAPFLERSMQELAACGRSSDALTAQESTVAGLVVAGLTNKEIARRLMLSVKTVEYHLSNVFAKLGVSSRTALVALLVRGQPLRA
ncbi:helix-turn-helix transcriptional regulator [Herbidospora mongoliensis]|uniref:helix-turn-helix transcriptional regulator n=1 Tax=Herbidospora mongoliensis TaxID=688067 RepID=UPI0008352A53|nr:helix-turn-helix transcriptional regulator [Herbidospora mongoliensis]